MPETICQGCARDVMESEGSSCSDGVPESLVLSFGSDDEGRYLCPSCLDKECPECRSHGEPFWYGMQEAPIQVKKCPKCNRELRVERGF